MAALEKHAGKLSSYYRDLFSAFAETSTRSTPAPDSNGGFINQLTERELGVLQSMAEDHTNHQIAEKLILADGTIKYYVHTVLEKLGVNNRTQAIIEAKKQKLI